MQLTRYAYDVAIRDAEEKARDVRLGKTTRNQALTLASRLRAERAQLDL